MPPRTEKPEPFSEKLTRFFRLIGAIGGALFGLFFIMLFFSFLGGGSQAREPTSGNVAIIPLHGVIVTEDAQQELFGGEQVASSKQIVGLIKEAADDPDINAIMLDIDSPGGSPVASDEIAAALQKSNKTTVAVIRELGASGAYWIASAADIIFAHRLAVTGSIGVTGSYLEFAGLLRDWNITYRSLTAGKYKDAGSPYKELTKEEEGLYRGILDKLHDEFITTVAMNRHLPEQKVRELATGWVYLGTDAKELGLVDELGGKDEALDWVEKKLNITAEPFELHARVSPLDLLFGAMARPFYSLGQGIGSAFFDRARAEAVPKISA